MSHRRDRVLASDRPLATPMTEDVIWAALMGLVLPVLVLIGWALGVTAAGAGLSTLLWMVPLAGLTAALGVVGILRHRRGWTWRDLGFVRPCRSLWHLLWEIPVLMVASAFLAAGVAGVLGAKPPAGSQDPLVGPSMPLMLVVATAIGAVVLVPLAEEIVFRSVLLGWLCARTPLAVAVLLTAAAFALVHLNPVLMLYIAPWGLGVTMLRVWHGTMWASFITHAVNNAVVSGLAFTALG